MKLASIIPKLLYIRVAFAAIILGVFIGIYFGNFASVYLSQVAYVYMFLVRACMLPLIISAIISNVAELVISSTAREYIKRAFVIFIIGMFFASSFGVVLAIYFNIGGNLNSQALSMIGGQIAQLDTLSQTAPHVYKLVNFINSFVTHNFIDAVIREQYLAVMIFSCLVGVALGAVRTREGIVTLRLIKGFYLTFLKLIRGILHLLPFGLLAIVADLTAEIGVNTLYSFIRLMFIVWLGVFFLFMLYWLVLSYKLNKNPFRVLVDLRQPLMIASLTTSGFAALPYTISALIDNLKIKKEQAQLLAPLSVCFNTQGSTFFFSVLAIFTIQLFGNPIDLSTLLIVVFGAIFTSISASGIPALAKYSMLSIILDPLGVPSAALLALFMTLSYLMDPLVSLANTMGHGMTVALSTKTKKTTSVIIVPSERASS